MLLHTWQELDRKLFRRLFLALAVLVSAGSALTYKIDSESAFARVSGQELAKIEQQVVVFDSRMSDIQADLQWLSRNIALREFVESGDAGMLPVLERNLAVFVEAKKIYDQARFIDEHGMERVRVDLANGKAKVISGDRLQNKGTRYYFTDSILLRAGEVFISPLDLNIEGNQIEVPHKPMIRLATPLFDSKGETRGIAILNYLGDDLLNRLSAANEEGGSPVELLNRDGYWLRSADAAREWGFMFGSRETFASQHPEVWRRMGTATRGQTVADGELWTWSKIYPLQAGMRSSSGSAKASGMSKTAFTSSDYYWIALSHTRTGWHSPAQLQIALRYGLLWLASMFMVVVGSWAIALRQGRLDIANVSLERTNRRKEVIERLQHAFIHVPDQSDLFDRLTQDVIQLSGSEIGLVGEYLKDEEGAYLRILAFSNIAWNEETWLAYERIHGHGFVFRNLDNLLGAALRTGKPVIANDPLQDPRRGGLPPGHPQLNAFLALPVLRGQDVIGVVGLANRPGGYDDALAEYLVPVADSFGSIITARHERAARRQAEQATEVARHEAEAARQQLALLLSSAGEGVIGVDTAGKVIFANPAACQMLGWDGDDGVGIDLHGQTHYLSADGKSAPRSECGLLNTLHDGERRTVKNAYYRRRDGSMFPVEFTVAAIVSDGVITGAVNVFRDITERRQLEDRISHMALFDQLTDLPNRFFLSDALKRLSAIALRRDEAVGLLYIDLDGFKTINDTLGHAAGDVVLREIASRIESTVRVEDVAARIGGDEFLVATLVARPAAVETCIALANRIIEAVQGPIVLATGTARLGASIGIAVFPCGQNTIEQCIQSADSAMYVAKNSGKGSYALADGMAPAIPVSL